MKHTITYLCKSFESQGRVAGQVFNFPCMGKRPKHRSTCFEVKVFRVVWAEVREYLMLAFYKSKRMSAMRPVCGISGR